MPDRPHRVTKTGTGRTCPRILGQSGAFPGARHADPHSAAAPDRASTLSFWLLIAFLAILWIAGGASRADVLGQSVVRFSAWTIIVVAILALPRVDWRAVKEPAIILGAAALLVTLQLVPLPPAISNDLPRRRAA